MVTTESTNDSNPLIDRVLKRARGLIATHGMVLTVGSLLTVGLTRAALDFLGYGGPPPLPTHGFRHMFSQRDLLLQGQGAVMAIATALITAWSVKLLVAKNNPERNESAIQTTLETGRRILPIAVTALIFHVCVALGLLLLIVPGAILLTMWIVSVPVAAVEKVSPIKAVVRSRALTKGYRIDIFVVLAVFAFVSGIGNFLIVKGLTGGMPFRTAMWTRSIQLFEQPIWSAVAQVVLSVLVASIYVELAEPGAQTGGTRPASSPPAPVSA
jgi:hypothetical protein